MDFKYILLVAIVLFSFQSVKGQKLKKDSAFVLSHYIFDANKSNDTLYNVNIKYLICFPKGTKERIQINKLFSTHNKKKGTARIYNYIIKRAYSYPFINRIPHKLLIDGSNPFISNSLAKAATIFDASATYTNGASVYIIDSFQIQDKLKIYKIYCEGFIDTLSTYDEYFGLWNNVNRNSRFKLTYSFTYKVSIKGRNSSVIEDKIIKAKAIVGVNEYLSNNRKFPVFIEMYGHTIDSYTFW